MMENTKPHPITIDLNQFKLHIALKNRIELTLHFNSPSRRFYLSVIAFVVNEMKRQGKIISIPLEGHHELLVLLNETIGGAAGSSEIETLLSRIYMKWQHALPNLEEAPLFTVLGKKKGYEEGVGKTYHFTEAEKDSWANLFEYKGSHEHVRLKFAIDKTGVSLNDIVIIYEDSLNADAWEKFILGLKEKKAEPDKAISEEIEVSVPPLEKRKALLPARYRWIIPVVVILVTSIFVIWRLYTPSGPQPEVGSKEKVTVTQPEKPLVTVTTPSAASVETVPKEKLSSPLPEKISKPAAPSSPKMEVASKEKMAFPFPDLPSIAVLPFVNMSEDPGQEFLSDGITESIITALSKVPKLFVIARSSTFTYKGKSMKAKQVSEELGVQYVLEGSIQRSGDHIRITAQLIDALKGHHIWAERYDRDLKEIFVLQDEITIKILTTTQVKLTEGEQGLRPEKYFKGKQGLDCYLKFLEADRYLREYNIDGTRVGKRIVEEAIEMCPDIPSIYVHMSWVNYLEYWLGLGKSPQESIEKGMEMGQRALAMDDSLPLAHGLMSMFYTLTREYDKSIAEGERAVGLEPGGARAHLSYGMSLHYGGRPEEAIPVLQKAIRLNPLGETSAFLHLGHAYRAIGRFDEAVSEYKKVLQRTPNNIFAHLGLAAAHSMMGREQEAQAAANEVLRLNPKFSVDSYAKRLTFKDQSVTDNFVKALRKAGLK